MDRPAVILEKGSLFSGRYLIERVVGSGGMGVVYQVRDRQTARRRALKVLSTSGWASLQASDLPREVMVGAGIESPHVVDILDAGVDKYTRFPFLVMEFLRGEDLARRRARLGRCGAAEVAIHLHQVGHALGAIHRAGVVHRDLKPANIFLCHNAGTQVIKVLDFGIAKLIDSADILTVGPRAGTPAYMAPEQLRGEAVGPASDIYSLGMVAFELLVGRRYSFPEHAAEGPASADVARMGGRPSARERVAAFGIDVDLPPAFDAWFARATAIAAADRFPNALGAADALAEALNVKIPSSTYSPVSDSDESGDGIEPWDDEAFGDVDAAAVEEKDKEVKEDEVRTALVLPKTALSARAVARVARTDVSTVVAHFPERRAETTEPTKPTARASRGRRRVMLSLLAGTVLAASTVLGLGLRKGPRMEPAEPQLRPAKSKEPAAHPVRGDLIPIPAESPTNTNEAHRARAAIPGASNVGAPGRLLRRPPRRGPKRAVDGADDPLLYTRR
ncbi:MAG: serine/threonine protein kinase [Deltaproteobacteria bacterium]|nr:serine/threonine protein kinase [Deltaproteobacteria bacterium]